MTVPDKVKIGPHLWDVVIKKQDEFTSDNLYGLSDDSNLRIYIKEGIPESKFVEVLLHECLHAIESTYDLNLTENIVNTLGVAIYEFLLDNQHIVKMVTRNGRSKNKN